MPLSVIEAFALAFPISPLRPSAALSLEHEHTGLLPQSVTKKLSPKCDPVFARSALASRLAQTATMNRETTLKQSQQWLTPIAD